MSRNKNTDTGTTVSSQTEINERFAVVEGWGVRIGVIAVIIGFVLYVTGLVAPLIPIDQLVQFWGLEASQMISATGALQGWAWIGHLTRSDIMAFFGLVILISVVMASYLAILPLLVRRKDTIYVVLVILQLAVFVLAAGNFLGSGGH